jgi:hypothetical protein
MNENVVEWNPNIKTDIGTFIINIWASINEYKSSTPVQVTLTVSVPTCDQTPETIKITSTESLKD